MIEYKGLPIFGDDSNPRNTSKFLGFIGTFAIWFIFLICMIIIKPAEKEQRKYKDVQIVFEALPPLPEPPPEPEPEPEPIIEEPEPIIEPVIEIEEAVIKVPEPELEKKQEKPEEKKPKPVEKKPSQKKELNKVDKDEKPVSKPKVENVEHNVTPEKKPEPKKEPVKEPKNEPVKKQEDVPINDSIKEPVNEPLKDSKKEGEKTDLQPDMTNPVIPEKQNKIDPSQINWDELFSKSASAEETTVPNKPVKVVKESKTEGSAGKVADNKQKQNIGGKTSKEISDDNLFDGEASGKTLGALLGIRNVSIKGDGGNSEITFKGGGSDGNYFMSMDGSGNGDNGGRGLISPKNPTITLSETSRNEIDVSKTVTVKFTVLPNGNVIDVYIIPASALPPSVVKEIKEQVGSWKFVDSNLKSQGEFKYNIKVNKK